MPTATPVDWPVMRGPGEGGITRRTDGRWQCSVRPPGGQRQYAYAPATASRRDVRAVLDKLRARVTAGTVAPSTRLGPFLQRWLDDFGPSLRPSTLRHYELIVRVHLTPALGRYRLGELTPAIVQRYLRDVGQRVSPQTVRHHRAVLRRALNVAIRWGLLARNAAALAEPPRMVRFEPVTLSAVQVRQLLAHGAGDRLHALWVLAATTGMRQAELLGLAWRDIELEAGTLEVRRALTRRPGGFELVEPKTSRSRRIVPLTATAVLALRAHRARQHQERLASGSGGPYDALVFTTPTGLPLHASDVLKAFHRALEAAGLPRIRFHDLRHSTASVLLAQGVPARVVMELLGHSTVKLTLDTYSHVAPLLTREAADAMERAIGGAG